MAKQVPGPTDAIRNKQNVKDGTSSLTVSPPASVTYTETIWDVRVQATYNVPSKDEVFKATTDFLVRWESVDETPDWPGGSSGVTWGVGWDAGQHTVKDLRANWSKLDNDVLRRLEQTIGVRGPKAESLAAELDDVIVPRDLSLAVFRDSTLPDYYAQTLQAFPGLTTLPSGVQVALISLVYNRGAYMGKDSLSFDSRWEMRQIQRAVQRRDLISIYSELGSMIRVWEGSDIEKGMANRRHAEQALILPYVRPFLNSFNRWAPIA